jgi:ABC-type lipoprotein export system ATPase subunit
LASKKRVEAVTEPLIQLRDVSKVYCLDEVKVEALRGVSLVIERGEYEPTGNLDSRTSKEIIAILRELNLSNRITIILVTHDQDIARHAGRWLVLHDGEVAQDTNDFQQARHALHSADEAD